MQVKNASLMLRTLSLPSLVQCSVMTLRSSSLLSTTKAKVPLVDECPLGRVVVDQWPGKLPILPRLPQKAGHHWLFR